MDVGPDFYAAQTFPMGNLPNNDTRIIQIAWMDHWNGGLGEMVWDRNATFPVSLGLVTLNGQKRVTREPIAEISKIYESTKTWKSQSINPNTNLLSEINSKTFDLTVEVDLTKTTATKFGIEVANKTITYDITDKTLLSKDLLPNFSNRIKIRILVDWGQLEVFANDGVFSYSEQFAFNPDGDGSKSFGGWVLGQSAATEPATRVELFTDGEIQLVSMEFHEVARTW
jgi:levanase/fructan beta-fructosidase